MADKINNVFNITKSLSKPIYDYLKKSIVNNDLKANEKIDEKEIAENFGVSRTPVREAIIRLSVQGFVDIHYHRDSVVKDIPYEEIEEILQVIGILDAYIITEVVDKLSSKDIASIESLTLKMGKYTTVENSKKFFDTNFSLHGIIWDYLPEGFLRITLECATSHLQRYSHKPHLSEEQILKIQESSFDYHNKILTALKAGDKEKLSHLFGQHWTDPAVTFFNQRKQQNKFK